MSDLQKLAKPFPPTYVEKPPQGKYGSYVAHHVVNQALLATLGPFDFEVAQILYGPVPARVDKKTGEVKKPPLDRALVGIVARLTVTIDGRVTRIEEAGDCEDPQNWDTDGARLKDATSDGLKRCAMRLGLGLHLWAQEHYFLDKSLASKEEAECDSSSSAEQDSTTGDVSRLPGSDSETPREAPSQSGPAQRQESDRSRAMRPDEYKELTDLSLRKFGAQDANNAMADMVREHLGGRCQTYEDFLKVRGLLTSLADFKVAEEVAAS